VVLAGLIQIGLGLARAGFIAAFFPTSVIKGLLAAIGVILTLKQILISWGMTPIRRGDGLPAVGSRDHIIRTRPNHRGYPPRRSRDRPLSIVVLVVWGKWKPLKNFPSPRL
jgi:carbonic anhydrase/SulP family sulfate permease